MAASPTRNKRRLNSYVAGLTAIPISRYNRSEQRAYWINLYNALTVKLVLEHYPIGSIRDIDISPGLFADGPWKRKLVEVENEVLSLNDIEHRILRPIWRDPLIHYAVNCASVGCPNLLTMAFTAANTDDLLNAAALDYINSPRGAPNRERKAGRVQHLCLVCAGFRRQRQRHHRSSETLRQSWFDR